MLSKKRIVTFLLVLALSIPASTIIPNNAYSPVDTVFAYTTSYLVYDFQKPITSGSAYVSASFKPTKNHLSFSYGLVGSTSQYTSTYYIELYTGGTWGSWSTVYSSSRGGATSLSMTYDLTPGATYRIRITTTDPYNRTLFSTVSEYID